MLYHLRNSTRPSGRHVSFSTEKIVGQVCKALPEHSGGTREQRYTMGDIRVKMRGGAKIGTIDKKEAGLGKHGTE